MFENEKIRVARFLLLFYFSHHKIPKEINVES